MADVVINRDGVLSYRHLTVDDAGYVELLGTPMNLTHTQFRILRSLAESVPNPVSGGKLSEDCLRTGSRGQISVQIHHINALSEKIGGRKLILNQRGVGYYLNPWM